MATCRDDPLPPIKVGVFELWSTDNEKNAFWKAAIIIKSDPVSLLNRSYTHNHVESGKIAAVDSGW